MSSGGHRICENSKRWLTTFATLLRKNNLAIDDVKDDFLVLNLQSSDDDDDDEDQLTPIDLIPEDMDGALICMYAAGGDAMDFIQLYRYTDCVTVFTAYAMKRAVEWRPPTKHS